MRPGFCLVGFMSRASKLSLQAAWDRARWTCSHSMASRFTWVLQTKPPRTLRKHFLMGSLWAELRDATTGTTRNTAIVVITRSNDSFHMKIAITAQGQEPNALLDPRFGRARFFRIVDTENGQQLAIDNSAGANAVQGAGTQAAQTLARHGVQVVITGHVGPKALTALQAANIKVYSAESGTVDQAVRDFLAGKLAALDQADVRGHW